MPADQGTVRDWNEDFDTSCQRLLVLVVESSAAERLRAWRGLMTQVGPHIERWAERSRVLGRCRMATPDDARGVLVDVLERLEANDFANLRRFRERMDPGEASERANTATLSRVVRLVADDEDEARDAAADDEADARSSTPLRAWLLRLVSYAITDHVRKRLGWSKSEAENGRSKRDVNTDAARLADHEERGQRPAITDFLSLQRFLGEVLVFVDSFPADLQKATRLWLDDRSVDTIAGDIGCSSRDAAALVRAAKARLRDRFRDDWDELQGLGV